MLWILLGSLLGCEGECQGDSRMDGDYAAWSYVTAPTADIQGENINGYPWPPMFFNGWSEWSLEYVPSQNSVKVEIDGQPFTAEDFTRNADDCTNFTMSFAGTYLSSWGTRHTFDWAGALAYSGPHISGTWSYSDTWTDPDSGESGSIVIPEGQTSMNAGGSVEDTGG